MSATAFELARRVTTARIRSTPRLTPAAAIAVLEDGGYLAPRCPECAHVYKDAIAVAARLDANPRWRPPTSHVASPHCLRDRSPHCPCGPCAGPAEGRG